MKSFARKVYQRVSLFALASVIAVSSLASAVPIIFAQTANAITPEEVVYNALPSTTPATNYPSLGLEATSTSEFGDSIHLGGTNRVADQATVTLSDWAKYSDYSSNPLYSGNSTSWSTPITLNIYSSHLGANGAPDTLLATKTQTFSIPWRPETGFSYNGIASNVTFDLSGLYKVLPDDVIVGVAYNTQDHGVAPTGVAGPYNSLNVAVPDNQAVTVGSDVNTDDVFENSTWAGAYTDNGAAGTGIFRQDTGWGINGTVAIELTASPIVAPATPSNVHFVNGSTTVASGSVEGPNSNVNNLQLVWGNGSAEGIDAYQTHITYADGTSTDAWTSTQNLWLGQTQYVNNFFAQKGDGTYTYTVETRSASTGLWSAPSAPQSLDYDATAPTNVTVTPGDGSIIHGTTTFTVTDNDAHPSYIYVELNHNGGQWVTDNTQSGTEGASSSTLTIDTTTLTDGTYGLKVDAVDQAGNTTEKNYTYTVDNAIPSVPTNVHFVDGSTTIAPGTIVGPLWNINNYQVQWDTTGEATDQYQTLITFPDGTTSDQWTSTKNLWIGQTAYVNNFFGQKGDGVYSYSVSSRSAANGSWSAYSTPISLTYDGTAPVVHITSPSNGTLVNGTVNIIGTIADANPSVAFMTITRNSNHHTTTVINDNTGLTNPSYNWNTTNTPDGTYTIELDAKDKAGNEVAGVSTTSVTVTVDNHAPHAPTLLSPSNNVYDNSHNVHFLWTPAFGFVNNPLSYKLQIASDAAFTNVVATYTGSSVFTTKTLPDGVYYARVMDTDVFGAASPESNVRTFTVDTTDPSVSITTPTNNTHTNANVVLTGTVSDTNFVSYTWTIKDSHNVLVGSDTGTSATVTPYTWHVNSFTADGVYTITLKAIDKAGNSTTKTVHVTIDQTAPTAAFTFTTPGPSSTSFKVKFSEAVNSSDATNPANYFLTNWPGANGSGPLTGNATVSYNKFNHTATVTFTNPAWYVSPEQTWGVENIHDLAGNVLSTNPTTDTSTPMVAPDAPSSAPTTTSPTNNDAVTWTWGAATDPGGVNASGVKDYIYTLKDADSAVVTSGTTTTTTVVTNVPSDGTYTLSVYAEDNAGNSNPDSAVSGNVVVDTVAPAVVIVTPADGSLTGNIASFTVHATIDDAATYTILVNGVAVVTASTAPFVDYTVTTPANASNVYDIEVDATDLAGNTGTATSTVAVDNTAPALIVNGYTGTSLTPTINGTTDGATDVVTVDGVAATVDTTANGDGLFNWTFTLPTQSVGTHNLSIVSTDTYGNATTETATVNVQQTPGVVGGAPATTTTTVTGNGDNSSTSAVLGASTDTSNTQGVKGDSTTKSTNKTDNNTFAGLAWYWWILILAAIAAAAWWIIAAIRRRSAADQN